MTNRDLADAAAIVEAREAGTSFRAIAAEHGVSEATIRRICRRAEEHGTVESQAKRDSGRVDEARPSFRVFLGWDDRLAEPCLVARHSLLAHATCPVEVTFLDRETVGGLLDRSGVTSFSFRRFLVPHLCGCEGRALFADGADTLFLGDVAELVDFDLGGRALARVQHEDPRGKGRARSDTSVMLMDCARCACWTPQVVATASDDRLMRLRDFADEDLADLPGEWNAMCRVGEDPPPGAKIAHWSSIAPRCPPGAGDWIDASGSAVWKKWRERMRSAHG
jgi:hypothetical protein